ncbi:DNA topoisomerase III [Spirochaeta isovalerica]|uniref:DNA topoisomerase n=1 Tax=Spirochaeta isovalerica TaxID=150 RepID=A0A841RHJ2_9SPIO|nr:DNA topoisomerase III [Spirochaeta isovalerica]MBB6482647.1 DNA topoisomerase-3 [Spirochaeta isovalerica]
MKTIVLAEKPSVGRELARVLKCEKKTKSFCEGKDYIVTWAMGHLVELADPGEYDEKYQRWDLKTLPMLPEKMKHKVIRKTSHQFRTVQGILKRKDVDRLVIATDAGREGELVARWIMRLSGWKGKTERLWISSQTDQAIREGFKNLKPGKNYINLFHSAEARAEADWLVGLNITRALSCRYDTRLSAGRVQTPTLAMIVKREEEIENFLPQEYWNVEADLGAFTAQWRNDKGINRFSQYEEALALASKMEDGEAIILEIDKKKKSEAPPKAYDLTELQRDGNRYLGFSAKKTLQVLQGLYERHKYVTYPRTDSRHITTDMVPTLKDRLKAVRETAYRDQINSLLEKDLKPGKNFVDNSRVTDHHAIIPTEEKADLKNLTVDEKQLFDLIVRRFVVVLSEPYRYESISMTLEIKGEKVYARGNRTLEKGWKSIDRQSGYSEGENDSQLPDQALSEYAKGDLFPVKSVSTRKGLTKPPARYSEATLLTAMENPSKFVSDKKLKETIRQGGLGTPATRADIIEKLLSSYYIDRKGKELVPTAVGMELIRIVPDMLKSPELTAQWEQRFTDIAEGREQTRAFISEIREETKRLVSQVKNSKLTYEPKNLSRKDCPMCGKKLMEIHDKKGNPKFVCQSLACGYEDEPEKKNDPYRRQGRKEKAMNSRLVRQYSSKEKDTMTLGDMIKAQMKDK